MNNKLDDEADARLAWAERHYAPMLSGLINDTVRTAELHWTATMRTMLTDVPTKNYVDRHDEAFQARTLGICAVLFVGVLGVSRMMGWL